MKLRLYILLLIIFTFISSATVLAKKKLIRVSLTTKPGVMIQPKLRDDHQALFLIFNDLTEAQKISYELTYTADKIGQGVTGTDEATSSANTQKELVFGTCSKDVCVYHKNITDMILQLKFSLKSGKILTQRYQIKP